MKKTIKNLLYALLLFTLLCNSLNSPIYASDQLNDNDDISVQNDYNSEENVKNREELISKVNSYSVLATPSTKTLDIIGYKQDEWYYCGPASVKTVIQYKKGTSLKQSDYAANMETNESGTYVYSIRNELNRVLGSNYYMYILTSSLSLTEGFKYSIDQYCPVILNANVTKLPGYNGYASSGHYIVGYKYNYYNSGSSFVTELSYWDSYQSNNGSYGSHTMTVSKMNAAINAQSGYYIIRAK